MFHSTTMYFSHFDSDPTHPQPFDDNCDYVEQLVNHSRQVPDIFVYIITHGKPLSPTEGSDKPRFLEIPKGHSPLGATVRWLHASCVLALGWIGQSPTWVAVPMLRIIWPEQQGDRATVVRLTDAELDTSIVQYVSSLEAFHVEVRGVVSFAILLPDDFPIQEIKIPRQCKLSEAAHIGARARKQLRIRDRSTDYIMGVTGPFDCAHVVPAQVPKAHLKAALEDYGDDWPEDRRDDVQNLILLCPTTHRSLRSNRVAVFPGDDRLYICTGCPQDLEFQANLWTCAQAHRINARSVAQQCNEEPNAIGDVFTVAWPSLRALDYRSRAMGPDPRALSLAYAAFMLARFAPGSQDALYWIEDKENANVDQLVGNGDAPSTMAKVDSPDNMCTFKRTEISDLDAWADLLDDEDVVNEQTTITRAACALEVIRQSHLVVSWVRRQPLYVQEQWLGLA